MPLSHDIISRLSLSLDIVPSLLSLRLFLDSEATPHFPTVASSHLHRRDTVPPLTKISNKDLPIILHMPLHTLADTGCGRFSHTGHITACTRFSHHCNVTLSKTPDSTKNEKNKRANKMYQRCTPMIYTEKLSRSSYLLTTRLDLTGLTKPVKQNNQ